MHELTFSIKSINDDTNGFKKLFKLAWKIKQIQIDQVNVVFEFSQCTWLSQSAIAFLGFLAKLIEFRKGLVKFYWD